MESRVAKWTPLRRGLHGQIGLAGVTAHAVACWRNDRYAVTVIDGDDTISLNGKSIRPVRIVIRAVDGSCRHVWDEFQRIKNETVGEEWSAIEFYPPEAHRVDTAPVYYLLAWPGDELRVGCRNGRECLPAADQHLSPLAAGEYSLIVGKVILQAAMPPPEGAEPCPS